VKLPRDVSGQDLARRLRSYGYDVTRRVGVQAEMEHFSPLNRWGPREADTDQFSLGVSWRF